VYVLDRDKKRFINSGKRGSSKNAKERLVMNFEPEVVWFVTLEEHQVDI